MVDNENEVDENNNNDDVCNRSQILYPCTCFTLEALFGIFKTIFGVPFLVM